MRVASLVVTLLLPLVAFADDPLYDEPMPTDKPAQRVPTQPPPTEPPAQAAPTPILPEQQTPDTLLVPELTPIVTKSFSGGWPFSVGVSAAMGMEFHSQGLPVAFGFMASGLWRSQVGIFVGLLSSSGTPIVVQDGDDSTPSLADRISVPFGFEVRPLAHLGQTRTGYLWRFLDGIALQIGPTIEHLRTSLEGVTVGGLHLGASVEVPIYGGPAQGGVTLRLAGRLLATQSASLNNDTVNEGNVNGQLLFGLAYYP